MKLESIKSRRECLRLGCRALSTAAAAAALHRAGLMTARAQSSSDYKALVCIFLFGGNDANNLLIPNETSSYANYSQIRQNLAVPQASLVSIYDAASSTPYGLHPSLAPLAPLFTTNQRLAIMMNVGTLLQPVPRGSNGLPQLNSVPLPHEPLFALRPADSVAGRDSARRRYHRMGGPPVGSGRRGFRGRRSASHHAGRQHSATGRTKHAAFRSHHHEFRTGCPSQRSGVDRSAESARSR